MSLYGTFERLPIMGALASSSIVLSAGYTMFMFNRIVFGGSFSKYFITNIPDLVKREFVILLTLVSFTVVLGIYPNFVLDGLHYSVSTLIYANNDLDASYLTLLTPLLSKKSIGSNDNPSLYDKRDNSLQNNQKPIKKGKINPLFVTGFSDAEGYFLVNV